MSNVKCKSVLLLQKNLILTLKGRPRMIGVGGWSEQGRCGEQGEPWVVDRGQQGEQRG